MDARTMHVRTRPVHSATGPTDARECPPAFAGRVTAAHEPTQAGRTSLTEESETGLHVDSVIIVAFMAAIAKPAMTENTLIGMLHCM
jgi:hypothetical protein